MALENVFIPYGGYWASPFVKWQGSLASENSVTLAASTAAGSRSRRSTTVTNPNVPQPTPGS